MKKKTFEILGPNGEPISFASAADPGKTLSKEIANRSNSAEYYNFVSLLPNPDPVLRKSGDPIKVYRELRSDPKVSAVVGSRKAGVKAYKNRLDPLEADKRLVALIEKLFAEFVEPDSLIDEILEAAEFGYKPFELLWDSVEGGLLPVGYQKDDAGLPLEDEARGIIGRPPEWFGYSPDSRLVFFSKSAAFEGERVPDRKFVVARRRSSAANPYGEAFLSSVFWPVVFKKNGVKFWNLFVEKYGSPFLLGKYPRGAQTKEIDGLLDALDSMYQDAVAAIPEGSSLEMIERKGGSGGNVEFANLCDYMDRQIAQSVLGQNLTSDVSSGSLAAAEVHAAVKDEIVEDDAKIVERFFADLIRTIRDVNFPSSKLPKFKLERPSKIDATLADRDEKLKNLGVGFTRSYFERSHGLNSDDFVLEGEPGAPAPASPTAGSGADFAEWNQGSGFDDQDAIDRLGDHLADPARSNAVAAEFVDPIIKLVEESSSYSEALGKLSEIYPKLSTDKLEATLASALFVSNALGNLKE